MHSDSMVQGEWLHSRLYNPRSHVTNRPGIQQNALRLSLVVERPIEEVIRRELLVLVTREVRLDHSLPRETECLQLRIVGQSVAALNTV